MTEIQLILLPLLLTAVVLVGLVWHQHYEEQQQRVIARIVRIPLDDAGLIHGERIFFLPNDGSRNQNKFLLIEEGEIRPVSLLPEKSGLGSVSEREPIIDTWQVLGRD